MTHLELPWPPSANHQFSVIRGRPVLTKDVQVFRQRVRQCVRSSNAKVALGALAVRIDLFPPDDRRRDCDNFQKPILDALQQAGAFFDDSQIVWLLTVKSKLVPNGKVMVTIREVEDGVPPAELLAPEPGSVEAEETE